MQWNDILFFQMLSISICIIVGIWFMTFLTSIFSGCGGFDVKIYLTGNIVMSFTILIIMSLLYIGISIFST